jgi:hypothetical protein
MSDKPKTPKRRAPAPALNTTPAPQPNPDSYGRWFTARTVHVDSRATTDWTPLSQIYPDYDAWHAQALPGIPPLDEATFLSMFREDQRTSFEVLRVRKAFATAGTDMECVNRAFHPAIRMAA